MKAGQNIMDNEILNFTERLIPISDFSKGKTSRIFDDVKNNNTEYIVLKNNQPTAMVISLDSYRELVEKASKMETLLDKIEEIRLFNIASARSLISFLSLAGSTASPITSISPMFSFLI